jgi:aspartyl/asparaginyl beta-hydroxylase (cupin superfamily)
MVQAFFSILDPGKSVPENEGPYLGYLRYNLGLAGTEEKPSQNCRQRSGLCLEGR